MFGWLTNITAIIRKRTPTISRSDIERMEELEKLLAKAMNERRDTDAAIYRKELNKLRRKMGYAPK